MRRGRVLVIILSSFLFSIFLLAAPKGIGKGNHDKAVEFFPTEPGEDGDPNYECSYDLVAFYNLDNQDPMAPALTCSDETPSVVVIGENSSASLCILNGIDPLCEQLVTQQYIDGGECGALFYKCSYNVGSTPIVTSL